MGNKFEKFQYIKAGKSDIDEIVNLNKLYNEKFYESLECDYSTEISKLRTKIELRIDQYEVVMSGDIKLGYVCCYNIGDDAVIDDLQLYPKYDCEEVILKVLYWGRCHVDKVGDTLYINNINMSDIERLSIYERDEFRFYKMISAKKGMMKWVWYHMWWM